MHQMRMLATIYAVGNSLSAPLQATQNYLYRMVDLHCNEIDIDIDIEMNTILYHTHIKHLKTHRCVGYSQSKSRPSNL